MPIRIGRWHAEYHRRAVHLTREPNPNCPDCTGTGGGWHRHRFGADWDECSCLDQIRTIRIPLWGRDRTTKEVPF